jgi:TPP-dependent trihydroxycyclohexane-1,2-dione (THcHDO) dehydratase
MSGDGGLAMLMGELLTAVQNKLPIKIVVFNNHALAFVEVEMMAAGIVPFGTDLKNPDFSKVGEACGLLGVRVTKAEELEPALEAAFAHDCSGIGGTSEQASERMAYLSETAEIVDEILCSALKVNLDPAVFGDEHILGLTSQ